MNKNDKTISTILLVSTFVLSIFWTLTFNGAFNDLGEGYNWGFFWILCFALYFLMFRMMRNPQLYEKTGSFAYIIIFIIINFFAVVNMQSNKLVLIVIAVSLFILGKLSRKYYIKTDNFEAENKKLLDELKVKKDKILNSKSITDLGYENTISNDDEECYICYDRDNYPQNVITIFKKQNLVEAFLFKRDKLTNEESDAVYKRLIELEMYEPTGSLIYTGPTVKVTKNTGEIKKENEKWEQYHEDLISRGMKLYRVSFANHKKFYGGSITPRCYVEAIDKDASIVEARKRVPELIKHQSITECVVIAGGKNMSFSDIANKWMERKHLGYYSVV